MKIRRTSCRTAPINEIRPLATRRPIFTHLALRAASIAAHALDHTPTMRAVRCADGFPLPPQAAARLVGSAAAWTRNVILARARENAAGKSADSGSR